MSIHLLEICAFRHVHPMYTFLFLFQYACNQMGTSTNLTLTCTLFCQDHYSADLVYHSSDETISDLALTNEFYHCPLLS